MGRGLVSPVLLPALLPRRQMQKNSRGSRLLWLCCWGRMLPLCCRSACMIMDATGAFLVAMSIPVYVVYFEFETVESEPEERRCLTALDC